MDKLCGQNFILYLEKNIHDTKYYLRGQTAFNEVTYHPAVLLNFSNHIKSLPMLGS